MFFHNYSVRHIVLYVYLWFVLNCAFVEMYPIMSYHHEPYDPEITRNILDFAQASYCNVFENCKTCNTTDIPSVKIFTALQSKTIVGFSYSHASVMVSYRGTSNIINWLEDFTVVKVCPKKYNIPQQDDTNRCFEKGFWEVYSATRAKVYAEIYRLAALHNTTAVIVTGHSLGAALATLLAFDLATDISTKDARFEHRHRMKHTVTDNHTGLSVTNIKLVTFGSPRVGNPSFVKAFQHYIDTSIIIPTRITHASDIIPHTPFIDKKWFLLGNFEHIPHEIFYNKPSTSYHICNDSLHEDPRCSMQFSHLEDLSILDHLTYMNVTMGIAGC